MKGRGDQLIDPLSFSHPPYAIEFYFSVRPAFEISLIFRKSNMEWGQFSFFCLPTGKALKNEVKIKGSNVGFEESIHQMVSEGIA